MTADMLPRRSPRWLLLGAGVGTAFEMAEFRTLLLPSCLMSAPMLLSHPPEINRIPRSLRPSVRAFFSVPDCTFEASMTTLPVGQRPPTRLPLVAMLVCPHEAG